MTSAIKFIRQPLRRFIYANCHRIWRPGAAGN